ncbi:MAG: CYTH domain-containing protein [Lachnospiraceae bacterium]|nr:CYTH domain-containing protein [Lachnospiraceae bacterium]
MEIERKFLISSLPDDLESYPFHLIEQGYLNTDPVVRVRRQDNEFYLTYKGKGFLAREEYNLPLNREAYEHLITKADGNIICKKRYLIPIKDSDLTIELDVFEGAFAPLILAEVEFTSIEEAESFTPPAWFKEDVTNDRHYSNSYLSSVDLAAQRP